ncbi:MAG: Acetoin:2,6-dichlorophenolindophenol oxidoreductase subunit alpha [Chlamydiae bacterium]|nr:Acetoin:2,6-dichlorophenolindophenol oxidoreductase subunit alpha [Chlamydiota bacterium]
MEKGNQDRFFSHNQKKIIAELGEKKLLEALRKMLLIRNFEVRGESAYLQGKIGGFFHSYMGQEAIQVSAVQVFGPKNWWITSYRCHALALLLGATSDELMAELFGRITGNAKGRGGSMHFYTDRMLGGFGVVAGQIPAATGAAFALKYQNIKDQAAICFLGDGAVAQGVFHESLNMASLWDLPCIFIIENNHWGMGTAIEKAVCVKRLAEDKAPSFNIKGYTLDGMDYFNCYAGFKEIYQEVIKTSRPVLVEAITDRFRGHSISDPGLYRTKEELKETMVRGPLILLRDALIEAKILDEATYKEMDKEMREKMIASLEYADESPWPDPISLEEDVFAP